MMVEPINQCGDECFSSGCRRKGADEYHREQYEPNDYKVHMQNRLHPFTTHSHSVKIVQNPCAHAIDWKYFWNDIVPSRPKIPLDKDVLIFLGFRLEEG